MFLIYIFLFALVAGFVNYLIQKFKKDKKYNRKFYDFGDNTALVIVVILLLLTFLFVNNFSSNPVFKNLQEQISYGKETAQPWLESNAYRTLIKKDTANVDLEFTFIKSHFDDNQYMGPSIKDFNDEGTFLFDYYDALTKSEDSVKVDMGELGLGLYYYFRDDHTMCKYHLEDVKNDNLKYLNTYLGIQYYYNNDREKAVECFGKEIIKGGDWEGAYYHLSRIYNYEKRYDKITPLVYNDNIKPYIPYSFRQRAHISNFDFYNYFADLFSQLFMQTNWIGFMGALLILVIWTVYLKRVNVYQTGQWKNIVFTIILACICILPVWLLYDMYEYLLNFELNGNILNDFLYCVFGIGVIEEFVKILPFLIILKFTKAIKEPIDYIMYASLSALGFAFVENFGKFEDGNIHIIHSRALTASISHMIDSSLIAYGLILAKFKYKKSPLLFGLLFFFIAALSHGFYDFWLLNKYVSNFQTVTFLYLLTSILIYASLINNALNHSLTSSNNVKLNTSKLASDLAAALIGVFLFEYICLDIVYGPTIANRELLTSTLSGGYLILFLSIRLSNIDIIPGEWSKIEFFIGFTPAQILYGDKKPNYNSLVGQQINIRIFRKKGILPTLLPASGQLIKREKISGYSGWFLVKLDTSFPIKLNKEYILIRAKDNFELIQKGEDTIISVVFIPNIALLENSNKKMKDFVFIDWAVASIT